MRPLLLVLLASCSSAQPAYHATQGDQGPKGDPGPKGDTGPQGLPGKDAIPVPQMVGGSRLQVRQRKLTGADGTSYVDTPSLYDTGLGVSCSPQAAQDGTMRCLPNVFSASVADYFSDASCTKPAAMMPPAACGGPPAFAYGATACYGAYAWFRVGAKVEQGYAISGGTCGPISETAGLGGYSFYEATAVADDSFLALTPDP